MADQDVRSKMASRMVVYAPIAALSLVFVVLAGMAVALSDGAWLPSPTTIAVGVAIYFLTIAVIARFGLANVAELESLGLTDSLCQLPNRRALHADIASLGGKDTEVALALVDLDGFKSVNDHYGHFVGDQLIKDCAKLLRKVCGKEASCYRLGGDEFAICVIGPIAGNILEGICRTLLQRLRQPLQCEERRIIIGASIGLSRAEPGKELSSSEMLRRSDVAMYASKTAGKMRCTWFSDEFDRNREKIRTIDSQLRASLKNDEFEVFYQPLVDANSRRIVAVEALVRWNPASGEKIGPNVFIPIAEETGLINAIGLWVLRRACAEAAGWDDTKLSVNVSAAQLRNPEFPVQLGNILEETGFPVERLELEITETCLVLDPVIAERSLDMIRGFGVNVVLDDFGTGYASIGFLRQFRFEKLKLDRSLIVSAADDEGSRAMMLSSITVARTLDMSVTAEGVETEEQAALVRTAGCDQIQGWLYYKAMPPADVTKLIEAQRNDKLPGIPKGTTRAA